MVSSEKKEKKNISDNSEIRICKIHVGTSIRFTFKHVKWQYGTSK